MLLLTGHQVTNVPFRELTIILNVFKVDFIAVFVYSVDYVYAFAGRRL